MSPIARYIKKLFLKLKNAPLLAFIFIFKNELYRKSKIQSHLTIRERYTLFWLSRSKLAIAEIGSYIGASACCFCIAAKSSPESKVICIDTWNNDAMSEGYRDTWKEFNNNTFEYNNILVPVKGYSTEVSSIVKNIVLSLDILFIDGDHSYEGVKADWDAYKDLLIEGSIIIFHDYGWAEGVKRVVHENVMPIVSSHMSLPNMWWGIIGSKN